jgi:hypothetical protein
VEVGVKRKFLFLSSTEEKRITNSFPIETFVISLGKVQVQAIFAKVADLLF